MIPLTSHGHVIDTGPEKFGFLRESNDLLANPDGLRRRMNDDGYLFLRNVLERDVVCDARREILEKLTPINEVDSRYPMMEAISSGESTRRTIDIKRFR